MSMQVKKKSRKKSKDPTDPRHITRAVTHIRLWDTNAGKLAALDALAPVYMAQQSLVSMHRPNDAGFVLEKEIKNVIPVLAKTHHYWTEHAGAP